MSDSKLLLNLQECDTKVSDIKTKLEKAQFKLDDDTEITKSKKLNTLVEDKLKEIKLNRTKIEKDIESLNEKISSINSKIYSGLIKTEKELSALQEEMETLSTMVENNEDQILSIMIDQDRYSDGLEKAYSQLSIMEQTREEEIPQLKQLISNLKSELDIALKESEDARAKCQKPALLRYDQLRKTHKGIAVSELTSNLCATCMVSVPTKIIQELKKDITFVLCNSCQRILCIPD